MASQLKTLWMLLVVLLLVSNLQHCVHGNPQAPCLFFFGDSIVDDGNNNNLQTKAKANYRPYGIDFPKGPTGRFTNGRNLADFIAQYLGFENYIPPFATASGQEVLQGVNYASGSAGIRYESGKQLGDNISMDRQLQNHQITISNIIKLLGNNESLAATYLSKCIYSVVVGNNDYINNYLMPQYYLTSHLYNPEQYATVLSQQFYQQLLTLFKQGARKVVVFGLGQLGYIPYELATCGTNASCVNNINNAVQLFNDKLISLLSNINKNQIDAKFTYINITAIAISASTGSTITNVPCCEVSRTGQPGVQCIANGETCANRTQYAYWDGVHPTEVSYEFLAERAYNAQSPTYASPYDIKHLAQLQ
ncbi:GDSL esterase/lipase At1g29670-like [Fagus crenata]